MRKYFGRLGEADEAEPGGRPSGVKGFLMKVEEESARGEKER